eukprot:CAMPEP_0114527636 /NCGR_PEP_ID=MMETSP0109-20121206/23736_1 /TAXON_ID=29199 /ORGANISM="Chlorarachnion reptans, Strain CCCM449" /LENGTH=160 /DNA_ID=CAMNT_0001709643 /DNA_START=894 /DNA_END=1374 /DNA_ORIENTATION=-
MSAGGSSGASASEDRAELKAVVVPGVRVEVGRLEVPGARSRIFGPVGVVPAAPGEEAPGDCAPGHSSVAKRVEPRQMLQRLAVQVLPRRWMDAGRRHPPARGQSGHREEGLQEGVAAPAADGARPKIGPHAAGLARLEGQEGNKGRHEAEDAPKRGPWAH